MPCRSGVFWAIESRRAPPRRPSLLEGQLGAEQLPRLQPTESRAYDRPNARAALRTESLTTSEDPGHHTARREDRHALRKLRADARATTT
jgi:hypothetical protein